MPVSVVSYGGRLGFWARVYLPKISFHMYSSLHSLIRKNKTISYMKECFALNKALVPIIINIETINRCNGVCAFCPANVKDEKRPFKMMDNELFEKIIAELCDIDYKGAISLYLNNEPFLDKRMSKMLKYVRSELPLCTILIFSNGTMLTPEILNEIAECVDVLTVNNYNETYKLTESSKLIYNHVQQNEAYFNKMDVIIQRRYNKEYLTNRAGAAPNKSINKKKIRSFPCLIPFTDVTIYPNGIVGLCCNDCFETTNYGDVNKQKIIDIFNSEDFWDLRKVMYKSVEKISFCKHCDVIDSGIRLNYIKKFGGSKRNESINCYPCIQRRGKYNKDSK